jgi:hypothetical protein
MPEVKNAAYIGGPGTITVDGDQHFGVTSCMLVNTAPDEQVVDISGQVQAAVGVPVYRLQLEANQDNKTTGALTRQSMAWHGQSKVVTFVPQTGGDSLEVTVIFKAATRGGPSQARHTTSLDLPVDGAPTITPPA